MSFTGEDIVRFNEFDARVIKMIQAALRNAEILDVAPDPTLVGYVGASKSARFIAYWRCGLRRRELFEERLEEKATRVKDYHDGQWVDRVVGERLSSHSSGPENSTEYPRYPSTELELDTSE